jgi:hypothetical protein
MVGASLVALLSAVNFLRTSPADYATHASRSLAANEWVSSGSQGSQRATSLFFTSRRTWGPREPGHRRQRSSPQL